jgi:hypothetical protein
MPMYLTHLLAITLGFFHKNIHDVGRGKIDAGIGRRGDAGIGGCGDRERFSSLVMRLHLSFDFLTASPLLRVLLRLRMMELKGRLAYCALK